MNLIRDLWDNMVHPSDGWGTKLSAAALLLLMILMMATGVWMMLILINTTGIETTKTMRTVVEVKEIRPPYVTPLAVGKVIIPQYHPESYWITFKLEGMVTKSKVELNFFDVTKVGDEVVVDYGVTGLSNDPHPTHIALIGR